MRIFVRLIGIIAGFYMITVLAGAAPGGYVGAMGGGLISFIALMVGFPEIYVALGVVKQKK